MLAGLVQTPANDDPITNPERARERRNQVLAADARPRPHHRRRSSPRSPPQPVAVVPPPRRRRTAASTPSSAGFFCDYLQRYLTQTLGITQEQLEDGGLTIRTTLRPGPAGARATRRCSTTWPLGDPLAGMFTAVEPGTGKVLAMSVNRRFGYDVERPGPGVGEPQRRGQPGRRLHLQGLRRGLGAGAGHPGRGTRITTSDPYVSRVYKNGRRRPYVVQNAGQLPADPDHGRGAHPLVEHLLRRAGGPAGQRRGAGADGPADGPVLPRPGGRPGGRREPRVVHPRRGGDQPAGAGQRLLDARRRTARSATRRPVIEVLDRTGRAARPAPTARPGHRRPLHARRGAAGRGDHAEPDPGRRHRPARSAPAPGPRSRATRSRARPGTSQDRFSVAFVGYTPQYAASVMVLNPKQNQDVGAYGGRRRRADLARRDAADPVRPGSRRPFPPAGLRRLEPAAARPAPATRPGRGPAEARPRPSDDADPAGPGGPERRRRLSHQLGGPLAEHHRGRRGPARGRRRQHRGVHDPEPGDPAHPQPWSTTAPRSPSGPIRAVPDRWTAVVRCARIQPSRAAVVVEHVVGQVGPRGAEGRQGRRPQQLGRQPHALPQPPPVGTSARR